MIKFNIEETLFETGVKSSLKEIQGIVKDTLSIDLVKFHTLSFDGLAEIQKISENTKYSKEYMVEQIREKEAKLELGLEVLYDKVTATIDNLKELSCGKYNEKQTEIYHKNLASITVFGLDKSGNVLEAYKGAMAKNDTLLAKLLLRKAEETSIGEYIEMSQLYNTSDYGISEAGVEKIEQIVDGLKGSLLNPGTIGPKNIGEPLILNIVKKVRESVGIYDNTKSDYEATPSGWSAK